MVVFLSVNAVVMNYLIVQQNMILIVDGQVFLNKYHLKQLKQRLIDLMEWCVLKLCVPNVMHIWAISLMMVQSQLAKDIV